MDQQLVVRRRRIERERARFACDPEGVAVDRWLRDSWVRCAGTVPVEQPSAPLDASVTAERWDASPIRRAAPDIVRDLGAVAGSGDMLAAVTDESGVVLWCVAGPAIRHQAELVGGRVGGRWDERSAGTNAIGQALRTGRPATVFADEHWCSALADLVCYSAPVRDPRGRAVGVLDLAAPWDRSSPLGLATVAALARVVEQEMRLGLPPRWAAERWLTLDVLGPPSIRLAGLPVVLTPRQVEVLTVLACVGTATLDELHTLLHGDRPVTPTTTKVEVSRLRAALGGIVSSRPYRLTGPVEVDLLRLLERLDAGDTSGALALYRGQLLPRSDSPFLVERRHHCDVAMRTAVLRDGTTADLLAFAAVHPFDVGVLEAAVRRSAPGDPLLPSATARLAVARAEPGTR
jgi:hypothetical protein